MKFYREIEKKNKSFKFEFDVLLFMECASHAFDDKDLRHKWINIFLRFQFNERFT
jgi:hypothetical protein